MEGWPYIPIGLDSPGSFLSFGGYYQWYLLSLSKVTQIGGKGILWLRIKEDAPLQSLSGSSGSRLETCELSSWETWVKLLIHGQTLKWENKRGARTEALLNTKWFWQGVSLISRDNPKNSIIPMLRKLRLRRWNQEGGIWTAWTSPQVCSTCPLLGLPGIPITHPGLNSEMKWAQAMHSRSCSSTGKVNQLLSRGFPPEGEVNRLFLP